MPVGLTNLGAEDGGAQAKSKREVPAPWVHFGIFVFVDEQYPSLRNREAGSKIVPGVSETAFGDTDENVGMGSNRCSWVKV